MLICCVKQFVKTGSTGDLALGLLERRLDNAVYRVGFAPSRQAARQLVSHKHLVLNGKRVNIPSITLQIGDVVLVRPASIKNAYFKNLDDLSPPPPTAPSWIKIERKKLQFTVQALPVRDDVLEELNEQLVVEYYSR